MSWAQVEVLTEKLTDLANSKIRIKASQQYANQNVIVKRYNRDYAIVTLDSLAEAEVEVAPKNQYEIYMEDASDVRTGLFYIGTGEIVEKQVVYRESGATAMPTDSPIVWQKCAGIYDIYQYQTFNAIIRDSVCLDALLNDDEAIIYMLRSTGDLMSYLLADSVARGELGSRWKTRHALATNIVWSQAINRHLNATTIAADISEDFWKDEETHSTTVVAGKEYVCEDGSTITLSADFQYQPGAYKLIDGVAGELACSAYSGNNINRTVIYEFVRPIIIKKAGYATGRCIDSVSYPFNLRKEVTETISAWNEENEAWEELAMYDRVANANPSTDEGLGYVRPIYADLSNNVTPFKKYMLTISASNTGQSSYGSNSNACSEIYLQGCWAHDPDSD